jgi:zinc transport system substrate-binding protein
MKKTLLPIVLCLLLLSGCGLFGKKNASAGTDPGAPGENTVTIAASFYPMYIMTINIAKDIPNVRVVDMTEPTTGCLHDYAVTPADMMKLEGASFLVINGADMESFMDKVIRQFPNLQIIDASKAIPLIPGEGDEGPNPHLWVSISNAILQVQNISDTLCALDPANADKYRENTQVYVDKLAAQKEKMHRALDGLPHRDIVTFHEAFPYFAEEFGLNIAGVVEREPGAEPSARELSETIALVNDLNVRALFAEPQYPAGAAQTIARETGATVYTLDPAVSGPMTPDAYLEIMDENLKVLQEALK